jgi:hypothetical protein
MRVIFACIVFEVIEEKGKQTGKEAEGRKGKS